MAAANFCYVCYSSELSVRDGVLVCDVCGTQAQVGGARICTWGDGGQPRAAAGGCVTTQAAVTATRARRFPCLPQGAIEEQEFQQGVDDARSKKKIRVGAWV
jgi:hypothetical protein